jgi:transposase-like protein
MFEIRFSKLQKKEENMISNKLLNPSIIEALHTLSEEGLVSLNPILEKLMNELMKIEREQVLGAARYERTDERKGYCNGFKNKTLATRSGKLQLEVPQTRGIPFYPQCLEKGIRSERALKIAVAEMYFSGVSTRKVQAITQELCDMEISSTQVSRMSELLDDELEKFRTRPLGEMSYIFFDAHYEKVRHEGQVRDLAVLKAIGVNHEGKREILGISCSLSEAEVHWRKFMEGLLFRGLKGIRMVVSDDHKGLRAALKGCFPSVPWQRCIFHLCQNAQSYAPNQILKGEISQAVRDIYQAVSREEAVRKMRETIEKYQGKASKFCGWLEENFEEGLSFYSFPRRHWKQIRTSNMVECLNKEVRRRTNVVRVFPNEASCTRLISAVLMDRHEDWVSGKKYLGME